MLTERFPVPLFVALASATPCRDTVADTDADCGEHAITAPATLVGDTTALRDDYTPSCATGLSLPDRAFAFTAPRTGVYALDTHGSAFDTVLAVYDGCDGGELACNDDVGWPVVESSLVLHLAAGRSVTIVVDGYDDDSGAFTLNVAAVE